jgi:predicted dehydrogenase
MTETAVGVVGVGSMGRHHVRVYNELPTVDLVGVSDADDGAASEVAGQYDTVARPRAALLRDADAVSIAVPTRHHAAIATEAIEAGTAVLVEKPFVEDPERGVELASQAREAGVALMVGHIERFNPAVRALRDVLPEIEPIAVAARRQGPPVERGVDDSAVMDLMIHDIDILLSLTRAGVESATAVSAYDNRHIAAQLQFEDGLIGTLTASRITQEKIRDLAITAHDCQVEVDYLDRSVQIHRHSMPEYLDHDGDMRYRHESIIERPTVDNGEPLKAELAAFVEAVREGTEPPVTAAEGIRAVELAQRIEAIAQDATPEAGVTGA